MENKNENHFLNSARNMVKGAGDFIDATSEGRFLDAVEAAWDGTVTGMHQAGKSMIKTAKYITRNQNDKQ